MYLRLLLSILISLNSYCTSALSPLQDSTLPLGRQVKVITMQGKYIDGYLQYATEDSLFISPGTRKDAKRGLFYKQLVIPYTNVASIKVKNDVFWPELVLGLMGAAGLALMITGVVPVFGNGLGDGNFIILLSPVFLGSAIWKMLKKKSYFVNGQKNLYDRFRKKINSTKETKGLTSPFD